MSRHCRPRSRDLQLARTRTVHRARRREWRQRLRTFVRLVTPRIDFKGFSDGYLP